MPVLMWWSRLCLFRDNRRVISIARLLLLWRDIGWDNFFSNVFVGNCKLLNFAARFHKRIKIEKRRLPTVILIAFAICSNQNETSETSLIINGDKL